MDHAGAGLPSQRRRGKEGAEVAGVGAGGGIPHCKVIWGRKTCENKMFRHCQNEKCVAGQECLFHV